jgi:hypothetical protein
LDETFYIGTLIYNKRSLIETFQETVQDITNLHSFSIRVIDQWNNLSDSTVTSISLNAFKSVLKEEDWNHFKFINSC